jgi:hypothetical protein
MALQPAQPQSIGGVLDTTFQLYKASVVKMIPLSLLLALAGSPSSIYVFMQGGAANANDPLAMLAIFRSPGYWLALGATYIGIMLGVGAASVKMAAIANDSDASIGTALQRALLRLPALVLSLVLYFIAVTIGSLLLLVPGIILSVSLLLFVGTSMFDNKGPVDALTASHRLVWGNWWRTTAILAVGFVILLVLYMVALTLIGVVTPVVVMGGATENLALVGLVSGMVIGLLVSLLMTPFYIAMFLAIYWDLKLRKEGGDLAARVGALNPA